MIRRFALSIAVVAAMAASSQAATISFSGSVPLTPAPFSGAAFVPAISQFDPSLGTLTLIQFDFTANISATLRAINQTGNSEHFTGAFAQATVNVTAPNSGFGASASTSPTISDTISGPIGNFIDYPGQVGTSPLQTSFLVVPATFTPYIGVGNVSGLSAAVSGVFAGGSPDVPNAVSFTGSGSAGGDLTITYTYTPVPEPTSVALMGMGVVGLGGIYLRRRRTV
jgi:hypothetical protein